jgi:MFS family permease
VTGPRRSSSRQPFGLLERNPEFARFWLARGLSVLGDWVTRTALPMHLLQSWGGKEALAILFFLMAAPRLLAPVAGVIADRVETRRLLAGTESSAAVVTALMLLFLDSIPGLLLLAGLSSVLSSLFAPAGRTAVPQLLRNQEDLPAANGVLATAVTLGAVVGPIAAATLVAAGGMRVAVVADVATYGLSVALLVSLPPLVSGRTADARGIRTDLVEGLRFLSRDPVTRRLLAFLLLAATGAGMLRPALAVLVTETEGPGGTASYGAALSAVGVGVVGGSALVARWRRLPHALVAAALAQMFGTLGLSAARGPVPILSAALVVGVGYGLQSPATDTQLQQVVPPPLLGRAFGGAFGLVFLGEAVGAAAGGLVLAAASPRVVLVLSAGSAAAAVGRALSTAGVGRRQASADG